jgi:hypothetical protein
MREEILVMREQIDAEKDPNKLVMLIKKLRKLLAEEQDRARGIAGQERSSPKARCQEQTVKPAESNSGPLTNLSHKYLSLPLLKSGASAMSALLLRQF